MKVIIDTANQQEVDEFVAQYGHTESKQTLTLDDLSVEEMGMATRVHNALSKAGIDTYGKLISLLYGSEVITIRSNIFSTPREVQITSLRQVKSYIKGISLKSEKHIEARIRAIRGY